MADPGSSLDAIRPLLPAWLGFSNLLVWVPGAFLVGMITAWSGGRPGMAAVRRLGDASWVERARAAYPVAKVACLTSLAPALVLGFMSANSWGPLSRIPRPLLVLCVASAAYLGGFIVRRRFACEIKPGEGSFGLDLKGEITGFLLLAPHFVIFFAMLWLLQPELGFGGMVVIALGTLGFGWVSWYGGVPLLRRCGVVRPAPERLRRIVCEAAQTLGVQPAATWVVRGPVANAVAFPLSRNLVFTEKLCEALDDDELSAVAHHELGHLSEPVAIRLARVGGAFVFLPLAMTAPIVHHLGMNGALFVLLGCCAVLFLSSKLARRMEERADAIGFHSEVAEGTYARALEKMYEFNLIPVVTGARNRSHPDLHERMLAAGVEPAYARPAPPSRLRSFTGAALAITCLALGVSLLVAFPRLVELASADPERGLVWSVGLSGGRKHMARLAAHRAHRGALEEGIAIARASSEAFPTNHHSPAYLATLLASNHRCQEAATALSTAEARIAGANPERCAWISQARAQLERCEETAADLSSAGL